MPALRAVCSVLDDAVDREWIPGCVARIWRAGALIHASEHGVLATHPASPLRRRPVQPDTIYDLASLTKVLCTTTLFAQAIDRGRLGFDATLPPELAIGDYRPTLIDLLEHASGLAAHYEFYHEPWSLAPNQRRALIETVRAAAPLTAPRKAMIYSDLGFLLLGAWLERMHGERIDRIFEREIAGPLDLLGEIGFRPLDRTTSPERVAPTEVYDAALHGSTPQNWYAIRSRLGQSEAQGIVHDDNCVIMGGVAGHAGLFGTADAVLAIALEWLEGRVPGWNRFAQPSSVPGSTRRLGFDGPNPDGSGSTGGVMSQAAFGHLGYTGTSVWIDPDRESVYVLLSNRVHPIRGSDAITDVRIAFHRAAVK
jgi:CubicO group peptidase (beta-lactamase class C family)